jgi:hypothetical protein
MSRRSPTFPREQFVWILGTESVALMPQAPPTLAPYLLKDGKELLAALLEDAERAKPGIGAVFASPEVGKRKRPSKKRRDRFHQQEQRHGEPLLGLCWPESELIAAHPWAAPVAAGPAVWPPGCLYSDKGPGGGKGGGAEGGEGKKEKTDSEALGSFEAAVCGGSQREAGDFMCAPVLLEWVAYEVIRDSNVMKQVLRAREERTAATA